MKYSEVYDRNNLLVNIPLSMDGRQLTKGTAASVMLLRVAYGKKIQELENDLQEVLKGLKKEGFDERSQAVAEMERVEAQKKKAEEWKEGDKGEKPVMPSEEELKKAENTRETLDEYKQEKKELEEAYLEARKKKFEEKVDMKGKTLKREELEDLYDMMGTDGTVNIVVPYLKEPIEVKKENFLEMIAANLVE